MVRRSGSRYPGEIGYGWPDFKMRWCTGLKTKAIEKYIKSNDAIVYIGIAADEAGRKIEPEALYPLVEWGMTERDCLRYCGERGFHWGGLYQHFDRRLGCWWCPLQSLESLRALWEHNPDLWAELKEMDGRSWNAFKWIGVECLEKRFELEEQYIKQGKSIRSREFFRELKGEK